MNNNPILQKAWELRFSGKLEEARALLSQLEIGDISSPDLRAEIYLLHASFARQAM